LQVAYRTTPQVRGLAVNPVLPQDCLDRLVPLAADEDMAIRLAARDDLRAKHVDWLLAGFGDCVIEPLLRYLDFGEVPWHDPGLVMLMIEYQDDPDPEWARRLARSADEELRISLALLPNLPPDVIARLAEDPSPDVVSEVAGCQPLSREQMEKLACHADIHVRYALGRNRGYPADMLVRLAAEGDPPLWMKYAMSERLDLPQSVYAELAADTTSRNLKYELARNPSIDPGMLDGYATSPDQFMRSMAARNPAISLDLLQQVVAITPIEPTLLPRIGEATHEELLSLVSSGGTRTRALVAERDDLPAPVLTALLADRDLAVVKRVISKRQVDLGQVWELVRRRGPSVFVRAAQNPNCDGEILRHFMANGHATAELYFEIARHPRTPAELLLTLVRHADARVSQAAAGNPGLPASVMRELIPPYL
jgi:hypothetical protein